jgi:hypothetical protein
METYIPTGVPVDGNNPSIKAKFGVTLEGTTGVNAAFLELSAYIQGGGLSSPGDTVIRLGDWIDLEGGLSVDAYGTGNDTGAFDITTNSDINPSSPPFEGYKGKLLRLIVVGINSFHYGRGVKDNGTPTMNGENNGQYTIQVNDPTLHVVFQFQNIPVLRRMNPTDTNAGGYPASEMRKYLTPVTSDDASGNFLAGLENAGVPEAVLWAPKRYVSARTTYNVAVDPALIEDVLWLPTDREMLGDFSCVAVDETAENQARLEYYDSSAKQKKHNSFPSIIEYWEASPVTLMPSHMFCTVRYDLANAKPASRALGVAPAFRVK